MLNEWLKVAYAEELKKQGTAEVEALLEKLPATELRKLADGTTPAQLWPHLEKGAHMDSADGRPVSWLDQFKGTPLLDQAIALEQEELQAEMTDMQKRQERRQQNKLDDNLWDMKDQIRMKKRLLELEKVKQEAGATAAVDTPAQGAGAPGPVPAEGVQDTSSGLGGGVAKTGGVKTGAALAPTAQEKFAFADTMGKLLARHNFEKAAQAELLHLYGDHAGKVMSKMALNLSGLGSALGGLASKAAPAAQTALRLAKANPAAAGAAIGAAGGALAGGPEHRLSGALGGAAVGGGLGHVAGGGGGQLGKSMRGGLKSMQAKSGLLGTLPPTGSAPPPTISV